MQIVPQDYIHVKMYFNETKKASKRYHLSLLSWWEFSKFSICPERMSLEFRSRMIPVFEFCKIQESAMKKNTSNIYYVTNSLSLLFQPFINWISQSPATELITMDFNENAMPLTPKLKITNSWHIWWYFNCGRNLWDERSENLLKASRHSFTLKNFRGESCVYKLQQQENVVVL